MRLFFLTFMLTNIKQNQSKRELRSSLIVGPATVWITLMKRVNHTRQATETPAGFKPFTKFFQCFSYCRLSSQTSQHSIRSHYFNTCCSSSSNQAMIWWISQCRLSSQTSQRSIRSRYFNTCCSSSSNQAMIWRISQSRLERIPPAVQLYQCFPAIMSASATAYKHAPASSSSRQKARSVIYYDTLCNEPFWTNQTSSPIFN